MRKFMITVNGTAYEVEVEELGASAPAASTAAPVVPKAAPAAPKAAPAPTAKPAAPAGAAGANKVSAPMPGKILDVKVAAGDDVKKGQVVAILEAMKMENEIVAPVDGKVATVNVNKGASVETGDLLITIG